MTCNEVQIAEVAERCRVADPEDRRARSVPIGLLAIGDLQASVAAKTKTKSGERAPLRALRTISGADLRKVLRHEPGVREYAESRAVVLETHATKPADIVLATHCGRQRCD